MKKMKLLSRLCPSKRNQSGLSLIEVLLALGVLGVITGGLAVAYNGTNAKVAYLLQEVEQIRTATLQYQSFAGGSCLPTDLRGLIDASFANGAANPSVNTCRKDKRNSWKGPYLSQFSPDSAGKYELIKISEGTLLGLERVDYRPDPSNFVGSGIRVVARVDSLPTDIAIRFLDRCNGLPVTDARQTGGPARQGTGANSSYITCGAYAPIDPNTPNTSVWYQLAFLPSSL